jgi:DNA-binding NtrC family response regulator
MSNKISLIADDDSRIRLLLRQLLQGEGFQVLEAEDGSQALRIIRALGTSLELLVSDVQMPKLDGFALAGTVRAEFPGIPIILMSGDSETVRWGRSQRQFEFIEKPFHLETLLNAVSTVMSPRRLKTRTAGPAGPGGATPILI